MSRFKRPDFIVHPTIPGVTTFPFISGWAGVPVSLELPRVKVVFRRIDYVRKEAPGATDDFIRFQQDHYRLWYQVDGNGILQNVTRASFGTARPGLLGLMGPGERHTYLHQRGIFEAFVLDFSLLPSTQAKCYWNSAIEGKTVLEEHERPYFENLVFDLFYQIDSGHDNLGLSPMSRLIEMLVVLFSKGLLMIEEEQFPKNRQKSLVALARNYMNLHYNSLHHQRELERECGRDINYLNVLFRKETGKTLYQHLTQVRMEHAKHLLEDTVIPVADIALKIGYPNANSFTRSFRKVHGISPTQYREKNSSAKRTTIGGEPV
jgi:AraC-like DNA-binding protein